MSKSRKELGDLGEEIAKNYFLEQGFKVVERNYWKKFGEIDLILKKEQNIFFVEVKTGDSFEGFSRSLDHLNYKKVLKFKRIVEFYLKEKKLDYFKNSFGHKELLKYHLWGAVVLINKKTKSAFIRIIKDLNF